MGDKKTVKRQTVADTTVLTQKVIRDGIPKAMFEQNTLVSFYYLGRDIVQAVVTAYIMMTFIAPLFDDVEGVAMNVIKFAVWNAFWFIQGLNWTGMWVVAHECGHQAFSPMRAVNDTVGFFVHSFLLVPYHSWRISHGNHHKHTNHTELDTVFVPEKRGPNTQKEHSPAVEAMKESPLASLFWIIVMLTLGWPGYLIANLSGQKYNHRTNHFEPTSPLFRGADKFDIIVSDIGIVMMGAFLAYWSFVVATPYHMLIWYFIPYLWVNFWLVSITFLQHTDERLPHYNPNEWNFVRGALSTVDRDVGFVNHWLHHITDSHVVHHLFSTMPHYNAIEVTRKYLPKILPSDSGIYMTDNRNYLRMIWDSWRNCRYVVPSEGVAFYH